MSADRSPAHFDVPIPDDDPGIEVANRQPERWRLVLDFEPEDMQRLRAGLPLDDRRLIRFIKQAALEKADAEAQRRADQTVDSSVEAAD